MRELPEPDHQEVGHPPVAYGFNAVLAIQRQAYEDGLRDAAATCSITQAVDNNNPSQVEAWALLLDRKDAILAMLTASQKEAP